ncbi:MAG: peptidylprolyl isomerase [Bryobacteraceae bacterium]|nr:peptidylprolyl isomerase [Bryobacteraceae bacterium]
MRATFALLAVLLFVFSAQAQTQGQLTAPPPGTPEREPGLYARLETTMGNMVVKLFETEAPITVKNFVDLAEGRKAFRDPKTGQMVRRPLYNGVTFHRVIPGFMIQTGDPSGTGAYDPGFTIPDEFNPSLRFDRPGRLGMANIGEKNTGNCQFFITEVPTPHLNNAHSIFGQVVEGLDVVTKIANVPRDANDKPKTPVRITRVVIERVGPPPAPAAPAFTKPARTATPAKK